MASKLLIDHDIAGLYHHADREILKARFEGEKLVLVREPQNVYDPNAVRIDTTSGQKLGYVPKTYSRIVAALIDTLDADGADFRFHPLSAEPLALRATVGDFIDPKKGVCHFQLFLCWGT